MMLGLPVLTDEARESLDAQALQLKRFSFSEIRWIKQQALLADQFGTLDRMALQRHIRQLARGDVRDTLHAAIQGVPNMIFGQYPQYGKDCFVSMGIEDNSIVIYANTPGVLDLPPVITATGPERSAFRYAIALLDILPYSLPTLSDLYSFWGWEDEDLDVMREWMPSGYLHAGLTGSQLLRVIRQTARHKSFPLLNSFEITSHDHEDDLPRLVAMLDERLENEAFCAFVNSTQELHQADHNSAAALLHSLHSFVAQIPDNNGRIFWTMIHDELQTALDYYEQKQALLTQAIDVETDDQPLFSDMIVAPSTDGAFEFIDSYYQHYMETGESCSVRIACHDPHVVALTEAIVNLANIQCSCWFSLRQRLWDLHSGESLHSSIA